jgi:hypothetical protein
MKLHVSTHPLVDDNPDMRTAAQKLAARGAELVATGALPADFMEKCFSLAQFRAAVEAAERYDPRTVAERAADEQDADAYDQIADARREARFGVGL